MKKAILFLTSSAAYLNFVQPAFAQIDINPQAGSGFESLAQFELTGNFISAFITLLFIVAVILALIYLIWGGIKWIMSGGDKMALQTAREHIIAAVIGLIVVFASYFIINFIISSFGLDKTGTIGDFLFNKPDFTNP